MDFDALALTPCLDAFGEVSQGQPLPTWQLAPGRSISADGIFDRHGGQLTFSADGAPESIRQPRIFVRVADFPADLPPAQGMQVTIRGVLWTVVGTREDGMGGVTLNLGGLALGVNPA